MTLTDVDVSTTWRSGIILIALYKPLETFYFTRVENSKFQKKKTVKRWVRALGTAKLGPGTGTDQNSPFRHALVFQYHKVPMCFR